MVMYNRILSGTLKKQAFSGKILFILGPRQVGKTTLARSILGDYPLAQSIYFDGDYPDDARQLQFTSRESMDRQLSGYDWIYIDEGQKIPNIGNTLKMMIDAYGDTKQIIVTGSSSLHLLDMTNEPLTGRKRVHELYPISWREYVSIHGVASARKDLEKLMIFGSYPEVLSYSTDADKIQHLREITSGQLYRDILEFQDIKKS
jgi:predicted AAA+ superfamily ATPase